MCSAVASRCPARTSAMLPRAGGRCWDRLCIASPATASASSRSPSFWFVMSMGLLVGFIIAYPMNWWLVAHHLKHGMITVRPADDVAPAHAHAAHDHGTHAGMAGTSPAAPPMVMGGAAPWPPVPV